MFLIEKTMFNVLWLYMKRKNLKKKNLKKKKHLRKKVIIDGYMKNTGKSNPRAAIYICFWGLFRLKGVNSVKLTVYIFIFW